MMMDSRRLGQCVNLQLARLAHLNGLHKHDGLHVHLVVEQRPLVWRVGLKNIRGLVEEGANYRQLPNMLWI
jgi:hypothetical protein